MMRQQKKLTILHLEDVASDAKLIEWELRQAGLVTDIHRVWTEKHFREALEADIPPTIILSDYSLPAFDGEVALAIAREIAPSIPFIFVTGAIGEELAISLLKGGATDYIMKDNLSRLPSAIERALQEKHQREVQKKHICVMQENDIFLRLFLQRFDKPVLICDSNTNIKVFNELFLQSIGNHKNTLRIGESVLSIMPEEHHQNLTHYFQKSLLGEEVRSCCSISFSEDLPHVSVSLFPLYEQPGRVQGLAIVFSSIASDTPLTTETNTALQNAPLSSSKQQEIVRQLDTIIGMMNVFSTLALPVEAREMANMVLEKSRNLRKSMSDNM